MKKEKGRGKKEEGEEGRGGGEGGEGGEGRRKNVETSAFSPFPSHYQLDLTTPGKSPS